MVDGDTGSTTSTQEHSVKDTQVWIEAQQAHSPFISSLPGGTKIARNILGTIVYFLTEKNKCMTFIIRSDATDTDAHINSISIYLSIGYQAARWLADIVYSCFLFDDGTNSSIQCLIHHSRRRTVPWPFVCAWRTGRHHPGVPPGSHGFSSVTVPTTW